MLRHRGNSLPWRHIARFLSASAQAALRRTSLSIHTASGVYCGQATWKQLCLCFVLVDLKAGAAGWDTSSHNKVSSIPSHLVDFTDPACWYPAAREMQRQLVVHLGPANSGDPELCNCPYHLPSRCSLYILI